MNASEDRTKTQGAVAFLPKPELMKPGNVLNSKQVSFLFRVDKEKGKMARHSGVREGAQAGKWTQRLLMPNPNLTHY